MPKSDLLLLLTPPQRQLLRDAAHRLGVREQVIARNAVLAALADPESLKKTSGSPFAASPELIHSLNAVARKLKDAAMALDDALDQISQQGALSTNAIESTDADERAIAFTASYAAAAEGERVASGILRGLAGATGDAGEGAGSAARAPERTEKTARQHGGARGQNR